MNTRVSSELFALIERWELMADCVNIEASNAYLACAQDLRNLQEAMAK